MTQKQFYSTSAWKWLSKLVKISHSDINGIVKCATCPMTLPWNDSFLHAGHWLKSHLHRSVALEYKNLGPQCSDCNCLYGGMEDRMAAWLNMTFGKGTTELLNIKKNEFLKLDAYTLSAYAGEFKRLAKEQGERRGIKVKSTKC